MLWNWIKSHRAFIGSCVITFLVMGFIYGCPPKTKSIIDDKTPVTREELQFELESMVFKTELRMEDLRRQEELRSLILQNALLLTQGQPLNPFGILTGFAAIYGIAQGGIQVKNKVKTVANKRKVNHG